MNATGEQQTSKAAALALLTERQRSIYDFIEGLINERGYGPTVREIGNAHNITSPNGVVCHLKAIEKKGLINRESHMSRAIELVFKPGDASDSVSMGSFNGEILTPPDSMSSVCLSLDQPNIQALSIQTDCFQPEIMLGDSLAIRDTKTMRVNDVVFVALNGELTLKRYAGPGTDGSLIFKGVGTATQPREVPLDKINLIGIVIGLNRLYD